MFVAVLAAAAFTRLLFLGQESFWHDEIWSIGQVDRPLADMLRSLVGADVHPPLYPLLLWSWVRVFGETEWVARLPSALFGVGAVAALYLLGRDLYDRPTALLAAGLLAVNAFAVDYSQETRAYSMLLLLSVLASWLQRPRALGRAAGYLSCAILLAYTHVYGLFLLIAHGLFALIWLPDLRLRMLVVGALVAAAFSPWLPVMLGQVDRVTQGFWIPAVTLASPVELISAWAGYNLPLALILIWLVAYDIARGEAGAAETSDFRRHRRAFLLLWIGVTAGVPAALSLLGEPIFRPKYTISVTAAFMLLVARALLALPTPWRRILGAAVVGAGPAGAASRNVGGGRELLRVHPDLLPGPRPGGVVGGRQRPGAGRARRLPARDERALHTGAPPTRQARAGAGRPLGAHAGDPARRGRRHALSAALWGAIARTIHSAAENDSPLSHPVQMPGEILFQLRNEDP
jgi:4-amino-4-deoxy-L-arabinose transferase-like glycosyltransferase